MKGTIDRFEGDFAVISTDSCKTGLISKALLDGAQENDVIEVTLLKTEGAERKRRISALRQSLEKNRE